MSSRNSNAGSRSAAESQRDSGLQPRVARNELPWETGPNRPNPNGVAARRGRTLTMRTSAHAPERGCVRSTSRSTWPSSVASEIATAFGMAWPLRLVCDTAALRGPRPDAPARSNPRAATPLGLKPIAPTTQGSSFLATLGWRPQSRWDWRSQRSNRLPVTVRQIAGTLLTSTRGRFSHRSQS